MTTITAAARAAMIVVATKAFCMKPNALVAEGGRVLGVGLSVVGIRRGEGLSGSLCHIGHDLRVEPQVGVDRLLLAVLLGVLALLGVRVPGGRQDAVPGDLGQGDDLDPMPSQRPARPGAGSRCRRQRGPRRHSRWPPAALGCVLGRGPRGHQR